MLGFTLSVFNILDFPFARLMVLQSVIGERVCESLVEKPERDLSECCCEVLFKF